MQKLHSGGEDFRRFVGSLKLAVRVALGKSSVTGEHLGTLMCCEMEAAINSGSLTFVESSTNGPRVITLARLSADVSHHCQQSAHTCQSRSLHKLPEESAITCNY